jgi:hypothetical protein
MMSLAAAHVRLGACKCRLGIFQTSDGQEHEQDSEDNPNVNAASRHYCGVERCEDFGIKPRVMPSAFR